MDKKEKRILLICIGGIIILISIMIIGSILAEKSVTKGKCYDERNNEIVGNICLIKKETLFGIDANWVMFPAMIITFLITYIMVIYEDEK